jgi:lysophospholipase L1-like esterase
MERLRQLVKRTEPTKWVFIGDSITHGALHTFGWRDYVELFEERVRFELSRGMDVVINTGISGDTTRGLLNTFDWRVKQFRPDAVLIMIGMNDCSTGSGIGIDEFERNVGRLVERVTECGAVPALQTTCPILPGGAPDREPTFGSYMEAIRRVARARNLPLIDHEQFWRERAARCGYWMSNAFHPNEYGHRAFAELLYRELQIFDPASHSCRFYYP